MDKQSKTGSLYDELAAWLEDVKQHELTDFISVVEQVKAFAGAAEAIPAEKVTQFIDNFKYDLHQFATLAQHEVDNSVYVGLVKEQFWQKLADITDRSQVEWAELDDDFKHHGHYQVGDYIGFGELQCVNCDQSLMIFHNSKVSECANCGGHEFIRKPFTP